MASTRIILHCSEHCVETAARREFEKLMSDYFDGKGSSDIEAKLELVSLFLRTADFPALRASDLRLSGEMDSRVLLIRDPNAGHGYRIDFE